MLNETQNSIIYYINEFKWPVTFLIIAFYLRYLWRKSEKENEKAREEKQAAAKRFTEEMGCKKCGGMMSLGSMKHCLGCEPYGPSEWYQTPYINTYDVKPLNRIQNDK